MCPCCCWAAASAPGSSRSQLVRPQWLQPWRSWPESIIPRPIRSSRCARRFRNNGGPGAMPPGRDLTLPRTVLYSASLGDRRIVMRSTLAFCFFFLMCMGGAHFISGHVDGPHTFSLSATLVSLGILGGAGIAAAAKSSRPRLGEGLTVLVPVILFVPLLVAYFYVALGLGYESEGSAGSTH